MLLSIGIAYKCGRNICHIHVIHCVLQHFASFTTLVTEMSMVSYYILKILYPYLVYEQQLVPGNHRLSVLSTQIIVKFI